MKKFRKKIYKISRKTLGERRVQSLRDGWFRAKCGLKKGSFFEIRSSVWVQGRGLFLHGAALNSKDQVIKVLMKHPNGEVMDISENLYWTEDTTLTRIFKKKDSPVFKPLFTTLIDLPQLQSDQLENIVFTVTHGSGIKSTYKADASIPSGNPIDSIRDILKTVPDHSVQKRELFDKIYGPSLSLIWNNKVKSGESADVEDYNIQLKPVDPGVSIVVPIYGRYDFIEYQLNLFSTDADMKNHELLYVIDDPSIVDEVRSMADGLSRIYPIHFKLVILKENCGYAGANNIGVSHSSAGTVLLLNSDVMPSTSGWVKRLYESYKVNTEECIVGARLLYEDNTIQHDGMEFYSSPFMNHLWTNIHPHKGLPAALLAPEDKLVSKDAVTGACLMLSRDLYDSLGGFNENYILGDFEDSDLCLKASTAGVKILHNSSVVLYHLERQSQSLVSKHRWKDELTYYNCWYHTQLWDERISNMKARAHG